MKPSDFDVMKKLGYIDENDGVRVAGSETNPKLKDDEIVVFKSFFLTRLRLLMFKMITEIPKKYEIFMHQLAPNVIVGLSLYI